MGKQDIVFAGGGEEVHWTMSVLFDAMGALSSKYNDTPATASRPYDATRDGFVISGGGGVLVIEELEHAKRVAQKFMLNWPVTAQLPMVMIWCNHRAKARCVVCSRPWQRSMAKLITSMPMAPSTPVGDTKELEALRTCVWRK